MSPPLHLHVPNLLVDQLELLARPGVHLDGHRPGALRFRLQHGGAACEDIRAEVEGGAKGKRTPPLTPQKSQRSPKLPAARGKAETGAREKCSRRLRCCFRFWGRGEGERGGQGGKNGGSRG